MLCMGCGALLNKSQIINGNGKCPFCKSENINAEIYNYQFTIGDYSEIRKISNDAQFILQMIKLKNENPVEYQLKLKQFDKAVSIPKCPTCQSTNIQKISTVSKVTNTALFGLYGNKRKKQFHCNSCGYEW